MCCTAADAVAAAEEEELLSPLSGIEVLRADRLLALLLLPLDTAELDEPLPLEGTCRLCAVLAELEEELAALAPPSFLRDDEEELSPELLPLAEADGGLLGEF